MDAVAGFDQVSVDIWEDETLWSATVDGLSVARNGSRYEVSDGDDWVAWNPAAIASAADPIGSLRREDRDTDAMMAASMDQVRAASLQRVADHAVIEELLADSRHDWYQIQGQPRATMGTADSSGNQYWVTRDSANPGWFTVAARDRKFPVRAAAQDNVDAALEHCRNAMLDKHDINDAWDEIGVTSARHSDELGGDFLQVYDYRRSDWIAGGHPTIAVQAYNYQARLVLFPDGSTRYFDKEDTWQNFTADEDDRRESWSALSEQEWRDRVKRGGDRDRKRNIVERALKVAAAKPRSTW